MSIGPDSQVGMKAQDLTKGEKTWYIYESKNPKKLGKFHHRQKVNGAVQVYFTPFDDDEEELVSVGGSRYVYNYDEGSKAVSVLDLFPKDETMWHYYHSGTGQRVELGKFIKKEVTTEYVQYYAAVSAGAQDKETTEFIFDKEKFSWGSFFVYPDDDGTKHTAAIAAAAKAKSNTVAAVTETAARAIEEKTKLSFYSEKIKSINAKTSEILLAIGRRPKELTTDTAKNIDILSDNITDLHNRLGSSEKYVSSCHSASNSARAASAKATAAAAATKAHAAATAAFGHAASFFGKRGGRSRKNQRKSRRSKTNRVARTRRQNKFSRM